MSLLSSEYIKWSSFVKNCNKCNKKGDISEIDRITCDKACGFINYEYDDCSFNFNNVLIKNTLFKISFNDYDKYILKKNNNEYYFIWICKFCKKDIYEKNIMKNISILLNSNENYGTTTYDIFGVQISPEIKENDFIYNLKKILSM